MTTGHEQYELKVDGDIDGINAVLHDLEDERVFDSALGSVGFAGGTVLRTAIFNFSVSLGANVTYSVALSAAKRIARRHDVRVTLQRYDGKHRRR